MGKMMVSSFYLSKKKKSAHSGAVFLLGSATLVELTPGTEAARAQEASGSTQRE